MMRPSYRGPIPSRRSLAAASAVRLAVVCVASIIMAGCGAPTTNSLPSREQTERSLRQGWVPRQQVLLAYDQEGLSGAMRSYRQARGRDAIAQLYRVTPERLPADELRAKADAVMEDGFTYSTHPPLPLHPPVDWAGDPYHDRTWRLLLNSWAPLDSVLAAHEATVDSAYLRFAVEVACDWIRQNPLAERANPFAWYDTAVGLRALQLAYLVDAAARDPSIDPEKVGTLLAGAWEHGWQLAQPRNFNSRTNHGLYQAAGLLALGESLPELRDADQWRDVGQERLRRMFAKSFSPEGVHLEHSPGYHFQITQLLIALTQSGLTSDPALLALLRKAEESLAWMIAPDSTIPTIGDSDPTVLRPAHFGLPGTTVDPELAYAVTQGAVGMPPAERSKVLPDAGYAVFRSGWPAQGDRWQDESYLIFTAAFHSRTHKHADDLSFVWYDAGRWLLIDSGRYGYYYDDPGRVYCESTRAHNTVEVDGQDSSRRSPETFGSALTDWGEQSGAYFVRGSILRRWPPLSQSRTLIFRPGKWVVVADEIDALASHNYEQWFHFAPDLAVTTEGKSASAVLGDGRSLHIVPMTAPPTTTLEAVRGQTEPTMQGWYSSGHRALEPNWAVGYSAEGTTTVFATLLCLSAEKPEVDFTGTIIGPETVSLRWRADGRTDGFTLHRSAASARLEGVLATPPRTR